MTDTSTSLEEQLTALANDLAERGTPADIRDNHSFLRPLKLQAPVDGYTDLLEYHYSQTVGGRNKTAAAELKRHWAYFLLCFSGCVMTHHWLLVTLKTNEYSSNKYLKKYGLKYGPTKHIVEYLKGSGLVTSKKGGKYESNPMKTRLYPVPSFARQLLDFYLHTLEDFDGDYLQFEPDAKRDPVDDNNWAKAVSRLPKNHPDKADMRRINEFLEGQQWSCKGPVRLKYKLTVFHGGRLYTRYQQLPDKRHKIRINTLINDEPICEVDFSANHLRLAMAALHDEDAGDNPYEDIMAIAGIDDRDLVKSFITTALGAASKRAAQSSWNKKALGSENFVALEQAVKQRYSKLILFDDWGIHAQNLEGAILRDVMLQGVDKGIVVLPVHDAVAVQQKHEEWAIGTMLEAWSRVAASGGAARPRVKVDRP
jgi:hypothetical protein